jgi:hypothetical protein
MFAPTAPGTGPAGWSVFEGQSGAGQVQGVDLLVSRFPTHEFSIRRLYGRDPEFRAVCDDYAEVQTALQHWQVDDRAAPGMVSHYRSLLEELESEALSFLDRRRKA